MCSFLFVSGLDTLVIELFLYFTFLLLVCPLMHTCPSFWDTGEEIGVKLFSFFATAVLFFRHWFGDDVLVVRVFTRVLAWCVYLLGVKYLRVGCFVLPWFALFKLGIAVVAFLTLLPFFAALFSLVMVEFVGDFLPKYLSLVVAKNKSDLTLLRVIGCGSVTDK